MDLYRRLTGIRKRAKQRGIEYSLDIEWLENRLKTGLCEITGLPFVLDKEANPFTPSIDRVDSSKGYTKDNCQLILFALNNCKGEETYNNLYDWASKFIKVYNGR